jgi:hypothetical protein
MTGWTPAPGQTLLVPSGPTGHHLFVLLFGPIVVDGYGSNDQIAMVNITSIKAGIPHDPACQLQPGDHPFVQHPSFVAYRHLRIDSVPHVDLMVRNQVWMLHQPCTPQLLARITAGVCLSKLTSREFKRLFGCY